MDGDAAGQRQSRGRVSEDVKGAGGGSLRREVAGEPQPSALATSVRVLTMVGGFECRWFGLLPQPGGFDGFRVIPEELVTADSALANR
jgi:hypothetical protein